MVRFNLVITLLLMINMAVKAELTNRMFDVRHVGYAEGLSSQRVFSIVEDGDGAMWIATKTGIDRYNGHTVKNYDLPGSFYYGDLAGLRLSYAFKSDERVVVRAVSSVFSALGVASSFPDVAGKAG